jgi:hypothetical protein
VPPPMGWWVLASCPHSTSWHHCWGAIMAKKQKVIFLLNSGAVSLSYHSLLVPSPMTRLSFGAYLASP